MNVAINITNADQSVVSAIKSLLQMRPELDFDIAQKLTEEELLRQEVEQIEKDYEAGKIKGYTDVDKMFEDILNG